MSPMKMVAFLAALVLVLPRSPAAGVFGEGFSSAKPGGPADIRYRAFTIATGRKACEESPRPVELRIFPDPLVLPIGERIHRSNVNRHASELVIEAYGANGIFLPAVPIEVSTADLQEVTESRSDWDYLEAKREGEDVLVATSLCAAPNGVPVDARVRLIVGSASDTYR